MNIDYKNLEKKISKFTGAPYVVLTDCCTHSIELCLRYSEYKSVYFSAFTYLSVLMTMHKLNIQYRLTNECWVGEYKIHGTNIWDSARLASPNMYRKGQIQCMSFGYDKPIYSGRGGAILLDNKESYNALSQMAYDGRDLSISPWESQKTFSVGYHYRPTLDEVHAIDRSIDSYILKNNFEPRLRQYPDTRKIKIT